MHAHDRTLLSQLGFADPDKRDRRHTLGCQYLALPENRLKIMGLLPRTFRYEGADRQVEGSDRQPIFERMIGKGEGKYRTTIGFIDLILWYQVTFPCGGPKCCRPPSDEIHIYSFGVAVEVKITPVGIGDILRQINLYRDYEKQFGWLVATAFPLSTADVSVLKNERIYHVRLGDPFETWAEVQEEETPDAADSLTL